MNHTADRLNRRTCLSRLLVGGSLASILHPEPGMSSQSEAAESWSLTPNVRPERAIDSMDVSGGALSDQQLAFLHDLRRRCFRYFVDAADPATGFVSDRAAKDGSGSSEHASSAACGFALAAYSVAAQAQLESDKIARERTRRLLHSLLEVAEHHRGFVYHFIGRRDGRRRMNCEASTVDTALMLAGVMCSATTFADDEDISRTAAQLIERTQWQAMLGANQLLHMGWSPEQGLLPYQWDRFSELTILVLMAIGAPNHAIDPACWKAWSRDRVLVHDGQSFLSYPPLFVHQYPMAFFDFRGFESPSGRSYWQNSVTAHHAQIDFLSRLADRYPNGLGHYGEQLWGVTSSDSVSGYRDWGGPYENGRIEPDRGIDGTIVPSAAAGGLAVVPQQALATLQHQRDVFGDEVYGRYGFTNAFNPATGWVGRDVIGIDTGISLLMAENLLSGSVWKAFMAHPVAQDGLARAGFRKV